MRRMLEAGRSVKVPYGEETEGGGREQGERDTGVSESAGETQSDGVVAQVVGKATWHLLLQPTCP